MTVAPNRPNDNPAARRFAASISEEQHPSIAAPPTLFALPNLAAADPCPEVCETSACSQPASAKETSEPLPVAKENPVETNQTSVDVTNEPVDESAPGRTESLIGNWGMRTVVIGVLLLTVISALFVAFNVDNDSDQPQLANDDVEVAEEVMLDGFAVSEGVEIGLEEPLDAIHGDVNSHLDTDIVDDTAPSATTAVLSVPLAAPTDNESPEAIAAVPSPDSTPVAESTAAIGASDLTTASPASVRSSTSTLPDEPPSEVSTQVQANDAPNKTLEGELDALRPSQQPTNDAPVAEVTEVADQTAGETVLPPAEVTEKPATEPVLYSSTPLGIGDWSRYLPPPADTTIQTSQTD